MKQLKILIFLLLFFTERSFAADYLKIIFTSSSGVPTVTKPGEYFLLNFPDSSLNTVFTGYNITGFGREYPIADSFPDYLAPAVHLRLVYYLKLNDTSVVNQLKSQIEAINSPTIEMVLPGNYGRSLAGPNDYYNTYSGTGYPQAHHHLDLVNAISAWEISTGLSCVRIGIVDVEFQHHPELDNKIITTPRTAIIPSSFNAKSHGNEVAGLAGGETNNGTGLASLGYNLPLLLYNGLTYNNIVNAIYDGCKVVNCSWYDGTSSSGSQPPWDPVGDIKDVLDLARLNNVTIVVAAGNKNTGNANDYMYPAGYQNVLSVTSIGSQWDVGDMAHPANWKDCHRIFFDPNNIRYNDTHEHNDRVDICAPGYYVECLGGNNGYVLDEGTSMAAPIVAAAAGLLYSVNPFFTTDDVEQLLKGNATDIYAVSDNYLWTGKLGAGRLNAGASMAAAASHAYSGPPYCINCPGTTTYITYSGGFAPTFTGTFYDKYIVAGSNGGTNSVETGTAQSTTLIATTEVDLITEFHAVATSSTTFTAMVQPCKFTEYARGTSSETSPALPVVTESLRLYPNPTTNLITVDFSTTEKGSVNIELINSLGMQLKKVNKNFTTAISDKTVFDLSGFPTGVYYVRIVTPAKVYNKSFVKGK